MTSPTTEPVQTWRDDVRDLFGVRWGTLVEWMIAGFLSAWLWTAWLSSERFRFPDTGPFQWLISILEHLSIGVPGWLSGFTNWLADPERSELLPLSIAAAVVCATFSMRDDSHSGLRILAMFALTVALEIDQSARPLLGVVLFSAIPAAIAMTLALYHYWHPDPEKDEPYMPHRVVGDYAFKVVGVFLLPLVAPLLLAISLVASYEKKTSVHPSAELTSEVLRELEENPVKLSEVDARTALGAFAAMLTSIPSRRASHDVAWYYLFRLKRVYRARR